MSARYSHASVLRVVAAGLFAASIFVPQSVVLEAQPPPELSRDITEYVLFAYESLSFKGQNACALCGNILGGHVGVNKIATGTGNTLSMGGGGSGHTVFMDDGTQVAADKALIGGTSSIYDLFANSVQASFNPAVVRHNGPTPFQHATATEAVIAAANLPVLPVFSPGATNFTVNNDDIDTLPPGDWGDVLVKDGGTLNLQPGIYNLKSLTLGKNVILGTQPGIEVRIQKAFKINNNGFVGPADDAKFYIQSVGVGSNDVSMGFSKRTEFHGLVFAPNGLINLGNQTTLVGHFWGKNIGSDFNVNVRTPEEEEEDPPGECVICEEETGDVEAAVAAVEVDENVLINLGPAIPTCDDGTTNDLCDYFDFDKTGATPDLWKAIFDLGSKRLLIRSGVTVTVALIGSGNNQYAPGIEIITTCTLELEFGAAIKVNSLNRPAGDIVLKVNGDITIDGDVINKVTGTNGLPGDITIATCCGNLETGDRSLIEVEGVDPGVSTINLLACCEDGDIVLNGLVFAHGRAHVLNTPRPDINVAAFHGSVTINANTVEPFFDERTIAGTSYDIYPGLLSFVTAFNVPGTINVQASGDITVNGHGADPTAPVRTSFAAIAAGTGTSNSTGGRVDVRSLGGSIFGNNRAFQVFGRYNQNAVIRLWADDDIALSRPGSNASFNPVVDANGGAAPGGSGTNDLEANHITVNTNALVSAVGGAAGTNKLTSCVAPTITGTVNPAALVSAACTDPTGVFTDCEDFGVGLSPLQ